MKLIDKYIFFRFVKTFVFAISILAIIACVIDYSEKLDDLVSRKAPTGETAFYFLNFIPHISALLFPLFIFITTIFFTSQMAYKSEIIAVLSSGVSFRRFLRPYLFGWLLLGSISLFANHFIVPIANRNIADFHVKYIWNEKVSAEGNVHLRLSPKQYVYVENYNFPSNTGYRFVQEKFEGIYLTEKIAAEKIIYDTVQKNWILIDGWIRENDTLVESFKKFDSLIVNYAFVPSDLDNDTRTKEAMNSPDLLAFADRELKRGRENVNAYLFEFHRRTTESIAGLILVIIGVSIASRKVRGGSGLHLALGILLSAFYLLSMQFTKTFSLNSGLNPLIAAWIPNIIFGVVAYYLYRRQMK